MEQGINIYEEARPWGNFRRFTDNTPSTVKILTVNPREQLSLQSHAKRSEFWRVIYGSGKYELDGKQYNFFLGDEVYIPINAKHRIMTDDNGIQILEIAFGEFDENDITRYEDKYGRS